MPLPVRARPATAAETRRAVASTDEVLMFALPTLLSAFRFSGHHFADLDPLGLRAPLPNSYPALERLVNSVRRGGASSDYDLSGFGLEQRHLSCNVSIDHLSPLFDGEACGLADGVDTVTLREAIDALVAVYCGKVAVEYDHCGTHAERIWIRDQVEKHRTVAFPLEREQKVQMLRLIAEANRTEAFLGKNFPNAKRFGIEGCEAVVPCLGVIFRTAAEGGVEVCEMAMAHRGRLNVLANLLRKPLGALFNEFGTKQSQLEVGDVKYHLGTRAVLDAESVDWMRGSGSGRSGAHPARSEKPLEVFLSANPSHLEFVGPVCVGRARARQDREKFAALGLVGGPTSGDNTAIVAAADDDNQVKPVLAAMLATAEEEEEAAAAAAGAASAVAASAVAAAHAAARSVMAVVVHGDSSVCGQGIVAETLELGVLPHFSTHGVLHLVINNQIGFTTAARSSQHTSPHTTNVAKVAGAPVIHCNADDPEAVARSASLAERFRQRFGR